MTPERSLYHAFLGIQACAIALIWTDVVPAIATCLLSCLLIVGWVVWYFVIPLILVQIVSPDDPQNNPVFLYIVQSWTSFRNSPFIRSWFTYGSWQIWWATRTRTWWVSGVDSVDNSQSDTADTDDISDIESITSKEALQRYEVYRGSRISRTKATMPGAWERLSKKETMTHQEGWLAFYRSWTIQEGSPPISLWNYRPLSAAERQWWHTRQKYERSPGSALAMWEVLMVPARIVWGWLQAPLLFMVYLIGLGLKVLIFIVEALWYPEVRKERARRASNWKNFDNAWGRMTEEEGRTADMTIVKVPGRTESEKSLIMAREEAHRPIRSDKDEARESSERVESYATPREGSTTKHIQRGTDFGQSTIPPLQRIASWLGESMGPALGTSSDYGGSDDFNDTLLASESIATLTLASLEQIPQSPGNSFQVDAWIEQTEKMRENSDSDSMETIGPDPIEGVSIDSDSLEMIDADPIDEGVDNTAYYDEVAIAESERAGTGAFAAINRFLEWIWMFLVEVFWSFTSVAVRLFWFVILLPGRLLRFVWLVCSQTSLVILSVITGIDFT